MATEQTLTAATLRDLFPPASITGVSNGFSYAVHDLDQRVVTASVNAAGDVTVRSVRQGFGVIEVRQTHLASGVTRRGHIAVLIDAAAETPLLSQQFPNFSLTATAGVERRFPLAEHFSRATSYTVSISVAAVSATVVSGILVITPLVPGTATVTINAQNAAGEISTSFAVTVRAAVTVPGRPQNLRLDDTTATSTLWYWDPASSGGPVEYYQVQLADRLRGTSDPWVISSDIRTPGTGRGVNEGSPRMYSYRLRVRACNDAGCSNWTSWRTWT